MLSKVLRNDWLEEEVGSLAKEGLRTLVVAKKTLTSDQYNEFEVKKFSGKSGFNFINTLRKAFARTDPKCVKMTVKLSSLFIQFVQDYY